MSGKRPVSHFVKALYDMVMDETEESIQFDPTGTVVRVTDLETFTSHVLPRFFRHSNFSSFSRQLNFYSYVSCAL